MSDASTRDFAAGNYRMVVRPAVRVRIRVVARVNMVSVTMYARKDEAAREIVPGRVMLCGLVATIVFWVARCPATTGISSFG